ncbi:hypothetical protein GCM10010420_46820 [Streptomyces glaucosporus]|uniref:Uncharacterized protein n=1 Tax=Streptomyces glaucosporus TaxID=284044 RepID=A0ABP5VVE1_9ACTN
MTGTPASGDPLPEPQHTAPPDPGGLLLAHLDYHRDYHRDTVLRKLDELPGPGCAAAGCPPAGRRWSCSGT